MNVITNKKKNNMSNKDVDTKTQQLKQDIQQLKANVK